MVLLLAAWTSRISPVEQQQQQGSAAAGGGSCQQRIGPADASLLRWCSSGKNCLINYASLLLEVTDCGNVQVSIHQHQALLSLCKILQHK